MIFKIIINKYTKKRNKLNSWSLYWLCCSFYKVGKYIECIKVYNLYKKLNLKQDNLKNICIWSYFYIIKTKKNKESLLKFTNYIVNNCEQKNFLLMNKQ